MAAVPRPSFVRVAHPELSLWQSAVHEVLADRLAGGELNHPSVRGHPLAQAVDAEAYDHYLAAGEVDPGWMKRLLASLGAGQPLDLLTKLASAVAGVIPYSDHDPKFAVEAVVKFLQWYLAGRHPQYRDWMRNGGGDIDFGLIEQRLPAGARIAVIGDWGTGLEDAAAMLAALLVECRPAVIVHLGDIYYSGTPREGADNFTRVVERAFEVVPPRLPVFNLPGNHDYYSGGKGFYEVIDGLNQGEARQAASYFCLRSADDRWQLVGMDTGFNDRVPGIGLDPFYRAPALQASESEWVRHKLEGFGGRTILLSHHPLFSAHHALNGPRAGEPRPNFNRRLFEVVQPSLDRVALWMWGHEHSLGVFEDGIFGLARGRLLGCSAFEVAEADDPYAVRFSDAPYHQPPVRLAIHNGSYDHGFAVVDLGSSSIEYHQFPAWTGAPPSSPELSLLHEESLL